MISKILSKSGIRSGLEKAAIKNSKKALETTVSESPVEIYKNIQQGSAKINSKPIDKELSKPIATIRKVHKSTFDLDRIKLRTKLLRSDVDSLIDMLKAD
jgi:FixJ family two-component response regulator